MSSSRKRERPEVLLLTLDLRVSAFPTVLQSKDILCGVKCHHSPHWAAASLKKANLFSFFFFSELSVENHSRGHNIYLKERRRCSINGGVESEPFTLSIYLSFWVLLELLVWSHSPGRSASLGGTFTILDQNDSQKIFVYSQFFWAYLHPFTHWMSYSLPNIFYNITVNNLIVKEMR